MQTTRTGANRPVCLLGIRQTRRVDPRTEGLHRSVFLPLRVGPSSARRDGRFLFAEARPDVISPNSLSAASPGRPPQAPGRRRRPRTASTLVPPGPKTHSILRLLRILGTTWKCGGGGTVLPRRRPRGSLDVACFTRDASSLAARFCNATPFSEVALSDGRTSSRSFPCWSFCEIRSSFRARRNAPTPLGHVLDLRWPCPKSSGTPFFNCRRDDDGRTSNRGVIGIRDIKATEEIQTTMVRLQAEPVERK